MGSGFYSGLRRDRRRMSKRIAMLMSWSSDRLSSRQASSICTSSLSPLQNT
jgi:hypothetical protein